MVVIHHSSPWPAYDGDVYLDRRDTKSWIAHHHVDTRGGVETPD